MTEAVIRQRPVSPERKNIASAKQEEEIELLRRAEH